MTKRLNPVEESSTTSTTSTAAPAPVEVTDPAAVLAAVDGIDVEDPAAVLAAVVPVVRDWNKKRREAAVVKLATTGTAGNVTAAVMSAPTGPDPVAAVLAAVEDRADSLARLVRSAVEHLDGFVLAAVAGSDLDHLDVEDLDVEDIGTAVLAAALTRIGPDPVDVLDVEAFTKKAKKSGTKSDRADKKVIRRDWSRPNVAGTYNVPASETTGAEAAVVTVRVTADGPTFTTAAGTAYKSPTAATADAQGWTKAGLNRGWGNPYEVWTRAAGPEQGKSLGDLVNIPE